MEYDLLDHIRVLVNLKKKILSLTESLKPREFILCKNKEGDVFLCLDGEDHVKRYQFGTPANVTAAATADPSGKTSNDWLYAPTKKASVKRRKIKKKSFVEFQNNPSVEILDSGVCYVLEDRSDFKDFDFYGESLQGRYIMRNIQFKDGKRNWVWWKPKGS